MENTQAVWNHIQWKTCMWLLTCSLTVVFFPFQNALEITKENHVARGKQDEG